MSTIYLNSNSSFLSSPYDPSTLNRVPIDEGKSLNVEPSAMLACKNVEMKTELSGSILTVAKRYFPGGEALFQNTFTAKKGGGWIAFEESMPGQINAFELQPGRTLTLGGGAYVASDSNVKLKTDYAGCSGWWKGIGLAKIRATTSDNKSGRVFFTSSEGITKVIKITQEDGPVIIDNNNLIAWTDSLKFNNKIEHLKSFLLSGEGSVNEVSGNGYVFVGSGESASRKNMLHTISTMAYENLPIIGMLFVMSRLFPTVYPYVEQFFDGLKIPIKA